MRNQVLRDGMGQATGVPDEECLDCVLTNALVIDHSVCPLNYVGRIRSSGRSEDLTCE